jgi:hypothetical protein
MHPEISLLGPPEIRCPPLRLRPRLLTASCAPDQPKTKIDVVYGDAKGNLEVIAQAARDMLLLEMVARRESDQFAWPEPFTLERS